MGIKVNPDGSFIADTVEEAVALSKAVQAQAQAPAPRANGAAPRPASRSSKESSRAAERRQQLERAQKVMRRLAEARRLNSVGFAEAADAEVGRGLGSVLAQVRRAIDRYAEVSADEAVHTERSPDREVGVIITPGPRFDEALAHILEAVP